MGVVVKETCRAIVVALKEFTRLPSTPQEWKVRIVLLLKTLSVLSNETISPRKLLMITMRNEIIRIASALWTENKSVV